METSLATDIRLWAWESVSPSGWRCGSGRQGWGKGWVEVRCRSHRWKGQSAAKVGRKAIPHEQGVGRGRRGKVWRQQEGEERVKDREMGEVREGQDGMVPGNSMKGDSFMQQEGSLLTAQTLEKSR